MDNGEDVYRRFLAGDESAFDDIFKEYRDSLTFFINRILADWDATEDIAIDVFTDVLVNPRRYNFRTSIKTYLFMIGKSKAIDYLRRKKKISAEMQPDSADKINNTYEEILLDEEKLTLNNALSVLPTDMRLAVHLIYFDELTYKEAAKIMKKTAKQVDNLVYRAKAKLRTVLEKEHF